MSVEFQTGTGDKQKELMEYLQAVSAMTNGRSLPGFVLQHGQRYTPAKRPKGIRKQAFRECFKNAYNLANDKGYIYVEGYAVNIIATLHAWCVDQAGNVIDNTWAKPQDCAYYGIPLDMTYVNRAILRQRVYGLLGTPKTVWEMHEAGPGVFKHKGV